jgi:hypothetical protein
MLFVGGVLHSLGLGSPTSSRKNMTNRLAAVGYRNHEPVTTI